MNRPEWGAMFFDRAVEDGAVMFWGARGAMRYHAGGYYNNYRSSRELELYPDRQSFVADNDIWKPLFVEWINEKVIPALEKCVRIYMNTSHIEIDSDDGNFHAVAENRDSGGYLYIGAWSTMPYENSNDIWTSAEGE